MFERARKTIIIMFSISAISFVVMVIGFLGGGGELLSYGFINDPTPAILMFVSGGVFVLSLFTGIGFNALKKDVEDEIRYLYSKDNLRTNNF